MFIGVEHMCVKCYMHFGCLAQVGKLVICKWSSHQLATRPRGTTRATVSQAKHAELNAVAKPRTSLVGAMLSYMQSAKLGKAPIP